MRGKIEFLKATEITKFDSHQGNVEFPSVAKMIQNYGKIGISKNTDELWKTQVCLELWKTQVCHEILAL